MSSNLPPGKGGAVFIAQASIVITAPIDRIWDVLLDFPSYGEWNPFVSEQVLIDEQGKPLVDQTPVVGERLRLTVDMPVKNTDERITAVDHAQHRIAWKLDGGFPGLMAERWQALSVVDNKDANGTVQVFYESREEFHGLLAYGVKLFVGAAVVRGFERTAAALKARAEARA